MMASKSGASVGCTSMVITCSALSSRCCCVDDGTCEYLRVLTVCAVGLYTLGRQSLHTQRDN